MTNDTQTHPILEAVEKAKQMLANRQQDEVEVMLKELSSQALESENHIQEEYHYCYALCLNQMDKSRQAWPHLKKSMRLAEENKNAVGQARSYEQMGTASYQTQDFRSALSYYERALALWKHLKDVAGQARCLRDMGSLASDLGQHYKAIEHYEQAHTFFKEIEDELGQVTCISNIGLIDYGIKGLDGAIETYKKGIEEHGLDHYLLYNNLAFLELTDSQYALAKEHLQKGLDDLAKRNDEDDNVALLYLNQGILLTVQSEPEQAIEFYDKAIKLFQKYPEGRAVELMVVANHDYQKEEFDTVLLCDNAHKEAITVLNKAAALVHMGRKEDASRLAEEAIRLDANSPYPYLAAGWIEVSNGEMKQASEYFYRAKNKEPNNPIYTKTLEHFNPYATQKVGANDPCPCGSKKKFKKCHGGQ